MLYAPSSIASLGAAASPASTDATGEARRPRDASRLSSRAVHPPGRSSPPDRRRTAGRPSSGSAPARSDLHGRGVGGARSPTRDQCRSGIKTTDREVPVGTHAPHVIGDSACERFDASDVSTPAPERLPSHWPHVRTNILLVPGAALRDADAQ